MPGSKKTSASVAASASATSRSKRVKKNVNYSPIKATFPSAASGGIIDSLQTAVVDIVISIVSSPTRKNQGAYIKPLTDAWRKGDDPVLSDWYIDSILPRRDQLRPSDDEPMKSIPEMPYPWNCIITLRQNPEEEPSEIGQKIASSFSSFSSPDFEMKSFKFRGDVSGDPPMPLNYYLLDKDCIMYIKKIYFGVSRDAILQDEELLIEFFGSEAEGIRVISQVSDVEWNGKMWFD